MSRGSRGAVCAVLDGKTSHKHLGTGHKSSLPVFKYPFASGALFLQSDPLFRGLVERVLSMGSDI